MNHISFCDSFKFRICSLKGFRHNDNSNGIEYHFIARMIKGTGRIVTNRGEEIDFIKGDIFYLPRGLKYDSYWTPDESHSVEWESYGFEELPSPDGKTYAMQKLSPSPEAVRCLDKMQEDMTVSASSIGYLYLFLGHILPTMTESGKDPDAMLFETAKKYISQNLDFKVAELARFCNMSESGLYAFFRRYANTSPIQLKNLIKVENAAALLETTDLSVEEISERAGFCSAEYFRKIMKQQTGKTPTEIRRERGANWGL